MNNNKKRRKRWDMSGSEGSSDSMTDEEYSLYTIKKKMEGL
jgi:hypothetical protein